MVNIPTKFDDTFKKYHKKIPVPLLRAAAYTVSEMNPNKSLRNMRGLFMIPSPLLEKYDKTFPKQIPPRGRKPEHLYDPILNTKIAVWGITSVSGRFAKWDNLKLVATVIHTYVETSGANIPKKYFTEISDKIIETYSSIKGIKAPRSVATTKQKGGKMASKESVIPTKFDGILNINRGTIPLAFLRVMALLRSGMKSNYSRKGSGGLFAISASVLKAYDKKFPQSVMPEDRKFEDLGDPHLNTMIAIWVINNIMSYYARHYPNTMKPDWKNPEYVGLIAYGFVAGYSEPKGIGAAMKIIDIDSPKKMTVNNVATVAKLIGLESRRYNPSTVSFAKEVTSLYLINIGQVGEKVIKTKETGMGPILALAGIGIGLMTLSKRKR